MKHRHLALIIAAFATVEAYPLQFGPKLVVSVTIDQLRTDYMEAFSSLYNAGGFKRLMQQGLVYDNASYPFATVDLASATAAISTGSTPFYNGIIANQWLDRETLQPVSCIYDTQDCSSPMRLKTSTVGDELKLDSHGRAMVYSFAADKESAILSVGHAADGAFWPGSNGMWETSRFYSGGVPKWLSAYNLSISRSQPRKANKNDAVVAAAVKAVEASLLGRDDISDLLCVSLSAASTTGKPSSDWQTEMESTYLQLDNSLQQLFSGIEKQIGTQAVMFVVTSTGYSQEEMPDYEAYRLPTGTFYINRTASLLNLYLGAIYGQGKYVEQCYNNELYLNHRLIEQKHIAMSELLSRCSEFLFQNSGVADVYTSDRILAGNDNVQLIRNGYSPSLNGDILIEVQPGWRLLNEDTGQTMFSRLGPVTFPIIFFGNGLEAKHEQSPVTADRIAPTLSKALRIRAPNACHASPLF